MAHSPSVGTADAGTHWLVALNTPCVHWMVVTLMPRNSAPCVNSEKNTNLYVSEAGGGGEKARANPVGKTSGPGGSPKLKVSNETESKNVCPVTVLAPVVSKVPVAVVLNAL